MTALDLAGFKPTVQQTPFSLYDFGANSHGVYQPNYSNLGNNSGNFNFPTTSYTPSFSLFNTTSTPTGNSYSLYTSSSFAAPATYTSSAATSSSDESSQEEAPLKTGSTPSTAGKTLPPAARAVQQLDASIKKLEGSIAQLTALKAAVDAVVSGDSSNAQATAQQAQLQTKLNAMNADLAGKKQQFSSADAEHFGKRRDLLDETAKVLKPYDKAKAAVEAAQTALDGIDKTDDTKLAERAKATAKLEAAKATLKNHEDHLQQLGLDIAATETTIREIHRLQGKYPSSAAHEENGDTEFDQQTKPYQQSQGDCYMLSSINGLIANGEDGQYALNQLIKKDGDAFVVTLKDKSGNDVEIKVTQTELDSQESFDSGDKDKGKGFENVDVLELAYSKFVKQQGLRPANLTLSQALYGGRLSDIASAFLGSKTESAYNSKGFQTGGKTNASGTKAIEGLEHFADNGNVLMLAGTKDGKGSVKLGKDRPTLVLNHAHTVVGVDKNAQEITLIDPHNPDKKITITYAEFLKHFDSLQWTTIAKKPTASEMKDTADKLYDKARNTSNADAQQALYKQAYDGYEKASYNGSTSAYYDMGWMQEHGLGVTKDTDEAFIFYKKAADNGVISGLNDLARCYEEGIGTNKDLKKAIQYYEQAIDVNATYSNESKTKLLSILEKHPEQWNVIQNKGNDADIDAAITAAKDKLAQTPKP